MNTHSAMTPALQARADEAEHLARSGHVPAAEKIFNEILVTVPDYSRALNFLAMRAMAAGNVTSAQSLIDRAAAGAPKLALIEANRGLILRRQGLDAEALAAFQEALSIDDGFLPAHFDAGQILEDMGQQSAANRHYEAALHGTPPELAAQPSWAPRVARARAAVDAEKLELAKAIESKLAPIRARLNAEEQSRFDECLDIYHGHKKPMLPKPGLTYFPKLAPLTFFPREMFDWVQRVEAATDAITEELQRLLAKSDEGFMPYVQKPNSEAGEGSPWAALNNSLDWGVHFLFNQGQRVDRNCAECPQTAALLESLPLANVPHRGPTAFFSRLKPGAHIPSHHGATNTRLICHLPLIVPPNCSFRVGNDVREWKRGEMIIFDDTISHEAWNRSNETRVVLIFDIWHPELSEAERELVSAMTGALAEFYPGQQHDTDH